ncbi:MAG: response regulator [Nannocystaceae bacterium]
MMTTGRILAVDDEEQVLKIYRKELVPLGWEVHTASDYVEAVSRLAEDDWGLVLIDLKLRGAAGPEEGLGLLSEIDKHCPGAKAIVITGYASPESIERAFAAGVYDYLEKTPSFTTLLRVKVGNVMELQRQRWLAYVGVDADRAQARELWSRVKAEAHSQRKGRLLEDLLELLLKSVPGFVVKTNRRGLDEELDLVVRIEEADSFWRQEGQYVLVECKNWSRPCDPKELDRFTSKLERRFGRARLGFFVAPAGFTEGYRSTLGLLRKGPSLVVPIDQDDLERLVEAADRSSVLKDFHQRTVELTASK